jgi:hypothetical protein
LLGERTCSESSERGNTARCHHSLSGNASAATPIPVKPFPSPSPRPVGFRRGLTQSASEAQSGVPGAHDSKSGVPILRYRGFESHPRRLSRKRDRSSHGCSNQRAVRAKPVCESGIDGRYNLTGSLGLFSDLDRPTAKSLGGALFTALKPGRFITRAPSMPASLALASDGRSATRSSWRSCRRSARSSIAGRPRQPSQ